MKFIMIFILTLFSLTAFAQERLSKEEFASMQEHHGGNHERFICCVQNNGNSCVFKFPEANKGCNPNWEEMSLAECRMRYPHAFKEILGQYGRTILGSNQGYPPQAGCN